MTNRTILFCLPRQKRPLSETVRLHSPRRKDGISNVQTTIFYHVTEDCQIIPPTNAFIPSYPTMLSPPSTGMTAPVMRMISKSAYRDARQRRSSPRQPAPVPQPRRTRSTRPRSTPTDLPIHARPSLTRSAKIEPGLGPAFKTKSILKLVDKAFQRILAADAQSRHLEPAL